METILAIERLGPDDRIINRYDAPSIVGISLSTIKRELGDPESDFPRPIKLTPGRQGFLLSDLLAWVERRTKAAAKAGKAA